MTIVVYYQSGYKTFKWFYEQNLCKNRKREFPHLVSYRCFIELLSQILIPLILFMKIRCRKGRGIAFIDSTPLRVCDNLRISGHKTFQGEAQRGTSSTGWFYGFKLHLLNDDGGEILSFQITRGLEAFNTLLLCKRSLIETINDQLKNIFDLEH